MSASRIMIGSDNYVRIKILGRYPSDGSSLRVRLVAHVYSLKCSCETTICMQGLAALRDQIAITNTDLSSSFSIIFGGGEAIRGSVNKHGHIVIEFNLKGSGHSAHQRFIEGIEIKDDGRWQASGFFVSYPDFLAIARKQCDEALESWKYRP